MPVRTAPAVPAVDVSREVAWQRWTMDCRLVVADPGVATIAKALADAVMDDIERAISLFRPDSEVNRLWRGRNRVSPLLGTILARALESAEATGGAVNPIAGTMTPGDDAEAWRGLRLDGDVLTVPRGVRPDLGAIGKAAAVDLVVGRIHRVTGSGVLVSLGGDIASAGSSPGGGWQVLVQDAEADEPLQVTLADRAAVATSSTLHRTRIGQRHTMHHLIDPTTGEPTRGPWRTATVVAKDCVAANTASTAAIVLGDRAEAWLSASGLAARLVGADGTVRVLNGFPEGVGS